MYTHNEVLNTRDHIENIYLFFWKQTERLMIFENLITLYNI